MQRLQHTCTATDNFIIYKILYYNSEHQSEQFLILFLTRSVPKHKLEKLYNKNCTTKIVQQELHNKNCTTKIVQQELHYNNCTTKMIGT